MFNGLYLKCGTCEFYDRPKSVSCGQCVNGKMYVRDPRRSKVNYSENYHRRGGNGKVADHRKYLESIVKKVIFNPPATIVMWADGYPKTVVKCQPGDTYDREKGLAMCIAKRCSGNSSAYCDVFKKWCGDNEAIHNARRALRDKLLLLASAEFQLMVDHEEVCVPPILSNDDSDRLLNYVVVLVDEYVNNPRVFSEEFGEYIRKAFKRDFGIVQTAKYEYTKTELKSAVIEKEEKKGEK